MHINTLRRYMLEHAAMCLYSTYSLSVLSNFITTRVMQKNRPSLNKAGLFLNAIERTSKDYYTPISTV